MFGCCINLPHTLHVVGCVSFDALMSIHICSQSHCIPNNQQAFTWNSRGHRGHISHMCATKQIWYNVSKENHKCVSFERAAVLCCSASVLIADLYNTLNT